MKIKKTNGEIKYESDKANSMKELVREAIENGIFLDNVNLSGEDLSRMFLKGVCFYGSDLSNTYFFMSDLENADFRDSDLSKTNFFGANLKNAHFENSRFTPDKLFGANLRFADFEFAFVSADFTGVNVIGAMFVDADLSDTDYHDWKHAYID